MGFNIGGEPTINILEIIQKIQLRAYNDGRVHQARMTPIHQCSNDRIKLPICVKKTHRMDPLTQFCKKCGMSAMEVFE